MGMRKGRRAYVQTVDDHRGGTCLQDGLLAGLVRVGYQVDGPFVLYGARLVYISADDLLVGVAQQFQERTLHDRVSESSLDTELSS